MDYIKNADKYGIDYRILPSISILESSGGRNYPLQTNNLWGYGSATGLYNFKSVSEGIDLINHQLANGRYYQGKSLERKIKTYNSANANYYRNFLHLYNSF